MAFALHPRLKGDSHAVAELPLSRVRLLDDARFPWMLLVPARPDVAQVSDLAPADQQQLWAEILQVQAAMQRIWRPDRVNLGIIGIVVPQLHVHLVARFQGDAAWPKPVWGFGQARPHTPDDLAARLDPLRAALR
jgi:diadenosine tetraphosphate (Ap4A) HIT family hydrolase